MSEHLKLKVIGEHPELLAPYGNYITIELTKAEKETIGGVYLPDELVDRDRQVLARVIAVGPGQRSLNGERMPCFTQPGDLVLVLKHAPIEIKVGGSKFHVVAEGDVVGKLDETLLNTLLEEAMDQERARRDAEPPPAEPVGEVEQETEDGTVTTLPSGLLLVTGKQA